MSKKDYYEVLGVDRNVLEGDLKKAFRQKAMKFHPDRNSGNKQFEDKLKKVTLAYSHLKLTMMKK